MITPKDLRAVTKDLTILYAEDEEWLRTKMTTTLERLFKRTIVAEDGKQALELYNANDVDLILTDINMPHMSGVELIKTINESSETDIHSVVLTAHNESNILQELIDLNVDKFLNKPVDKEKMVTSLYKVCRSIANTKLLEEYRVSLENSLIETKKKNRILETKLKQIAQEKNAKREKAVKSENSENVNKEEKRDDGYFETLIVEDREELVDLSLEIDSYISRMFQNNNLNSEFTEMLSSAYSKYASILNSYPVFYEVGIRLTHFAKLINESGEQIQKKQEGCALLLESLHFTMDNFRVNVWHKNNDNPTFYHASLINDMEHIENFLLEKDITGEMEFF